MTKEQENEKQMDHFRVLKFRAWKDENKKWLFWQNIYESNAFWEDIHYPDTLPVMQYTGLKDKNGKDIYEGDVVELKSKKGWKRGSNHMRGIGKVYYSSESLEYRVKKDDGQGMILHWGGTESIEVIGNIHENPELVV